MSNETATATVSIGAGELEYVIYFMREAAKEKGEQQAGALRHIANQLEDGLD